MDNGTEAAIAAALALTEDREGLDAYLRRMPAPYLLRSDADDLARHWTLIREAGLDRDEGHTHAVRYRGDIEEFWLGQASGSQVAKEVRALDRAGVSPLARVAFDPAGRFAICAVYPALAASEPDALPGVIPGQAAPDLAQRAAAFLAGEPTSGTVRVEWPAEAPETVIVEAINTARATVLANVVTVLGRHGLTPRWLEQYSDPSIRRLPVRGRRGAVKEIHRAEVLLSRAPSDDERVSVEHDLKRAVQARLTFHSLFDIVGPDMVGPSSSHTAGANRIGRLARNVLRGLQTGGAFSRLERLAVRLIGSFRDTGAGHGTHIAIGAGLCDLDAASPRLVTVGAPKALANSGIPWGTGAVPFDGCQPGDAEDDERYIRGPGECTNIAEVIATVDGGRRVIITGFSTGGGLIEIRRVDRLRLSRVLTGKRAMRLVAPQLGEPLQIEAHDDAEEGPGFIAPIYRGAAPREDLTFPFNTFAEVLEFSVETEQSLVELAISTEAALQGTTPKEIHDEMGRRWGIMRAAVERGLANEGRTPMGLSGGDGKRLLAALEGDRSAGLGDFAVAFALAVSEVNAAMGPIVACPTGGASGVLPGTLEAWLRFHPETPASAIREALLVAAFVGMIIYDDIPTAGAALGCQAEVGVGAAMAAAALATLQRCDAEGVIHAAILALKNSMGLVCDPVAGLVEVPCVKRNGVFAPAAVAAARMAAAGVRSAIPPDEVILAVREVGRRMDSAYKETSRGGLATTVHGKQLARRFAAFAREALA
jgi:L-serine dehydratase